MKLGPKEIKVVNEYFVRPVKNRLKEIFMKKGLPQLRTADEIKQPPVRKDVEDIKAVNEFNKRNPRADGGMLVKPSDDGSRPGYAEAKFDDPSANIKVGNNLGQGISQDYKKADGTIMYRATAGKAKKGGNIEQRFTSFKDAEKYRSQYVSQRIKPVSELPKDQQKYINKWLDDHPGVKWRDLNNNERNMLKRGQDVRSGTGSKTKKGAENPQFQPLDDEGKKIAKQVYGTTEVGDNIRQRINKGEITMDTKPVKFQKGKDISLKMKRGSGVVTGVEFPKETIDADGKIETAKQMEKRFEKFLKERVKFSKKGLTGTGYANADIAEEFPISEKQGGRLARYYINKLGLKYKEGPRDPGKATVTEKTEEKLKVTSGIKEERKLTQLKTKILKEKDLARKVDKAHRVSKSHMEKLGLQFDTNLVGMDSRIINQVILRPSEIKLNNLYARQRKVLDLLKENPDSIELKNRMTEINKGVKQIVKDTSGRLIGVTIDLNSLEPNFEGIKKKNTFTKFLGDNYKISDLNQFSDADLSKAIAKAVDAESKRGFVPNDFKNILTNKNSQKSILEFAKKRAPDAIKDLKFAFKNPFSKKAMNLLSVPGIFIAGYQGAELAKQKGIGFDKEFEQTAAVGDAPIIEKGLSTGEKAVAGAAAAGTVGTKPGRKLLGKTIRTLGTRAAAVPFAGLTIADNLKKGENIIDATLDPLVGAELLFPNLFRENVAKITSNPTLQKILKVGKVGRAFTPIGAGITAAGLGIDAAKFTKKRIEELRSMTPEQRAELRRQGEAQAFDPFQAAGGGIAKLAGDRSGAMLTSMNPDKDGLPGLLKRGKK
jgi:hypothetical protein